MCGRVLLAAIFMGHSGREGNRAAVLNDLLRSFLEAVSTGSKLWVSAHDLRQALKITIAANRSALLGNVPIKLPLENGL